MNEDMLVQYLTDAENIYLRRDWGFDIMMVIWTDYVTGYKECAKERLNHV